LDGGFLDFVKEELKLIVDGKLIPTIDIIITTQNWSQFVETWEIYKILIRMLNHLLLQL
jgi:hypothetical protein